jgi:hypothetical protein
MIDRELSYVLKLGDRTADTTATKGYIGGSPVKFNSSGYITGDLAQYECDGIAYHSSAEDISGTGPCEGFGLGTIIFAPAIVTLKKGTADAAAPWDTTVTFVVGNLLRATTLTSGSIAYACWTNTAYSGPTTGMGVVYCARVIAMTGSGSAPTSLTLLLGHFFKIV